MPDWLTEVLTALFVLASLAVIWTWVQAVLNFRSVKGNEDLRTYAGGILVRETALLVTILALTTVGILSLPEERSAMTRTITSLALIIMALGVVGVSISDYLAMRRTLKDHEEV